VLSQQFILESESHDVASGGLYVFSRNFPPDTVFILQQLIRVLALI